MRLPKIAPEHPAFKLEFSGPVALLLSVDNEEEVIALANHSPLGLGDCVYTIRIERSKQVASHIQTGFVFISYQSLISMDLPFGAINWFWYGKELPNRESKSS